MKRQIVRPSLIAFALSLAFAQSHAASVVLPTGSSVAAGSASITTNSSLMEVRTTGNAIINWQSFSIGQGATVNFIQESAQNSVLNRVLGNLPSTIDGLLQSNGKVFLINPAGIVVGAGGRIDVAGFVGSTLNMTDANFKDGIFKFDATPNAGAINNLGRIAAPSGGQILLVAPQVTNTGTLAVPNGSAILAAGQTVELFDTASPGLKVEITGDGTATNLGNILASAGKVGMVGAMIKNSGTLSASRISRKGGQVFLLASKSIDLADTSVISANGAEGGEVSIKVESNGELSGELVARGQITAGLSGVATTAGLIETSASKVDLNALKMTDTAGGTWQLSLDSIDINDSTSSIDGASTIKSTSVASAMLNNNFIIKTKSNQNGATGNLFVNSGFESLSPYSLTLSADGDIAINRSFAAGVIAMTAGGAIGMPSANSTQVVTARTSLQLTAGNGVDLKARTPLLLASAITNGGDFKLLTNEGKPQEFTVLGVTTPEGNISIENYGEMITKEGAIKTNSGSMTLRTHSPLTIGSPLSASQAIFLTAGAAGSSALDDILTINALVTAPRIVGSANSIVGTNIPTGAGFISNVFVPPNPPGSTTPTVNTDNLVSSTINNNRTPNQPYSSGGRSGPGDNFDQLINQMPTAAGPGEFGERPAMTLLSGTIGNTPGHFGGDSDDELDMSYQNGGQSHFGASGRLQQCL